MRLWRVAVASAFVTSAILVACGGAFTSADADAGVDASIPDASNTSDATLDAPATDATSLDATGSDASDASLEADALAADGDDDATDAADADEIDAPVDGCVPIMWWLDGGAIDAAAPYCKRAPHTFCFDFDELPDGSTAYSNGWNISAQANAAFGFNRTAYASAPQSLQIATNADASGNPVAYLGEQFPLYNACQPQAFTEAHLSAAVRLDDAVTDGGLVPVLAVYIGMPNPAGVIPLEFIFQFDTTTAEGYEAYAVDAGTTDAGDGAPGVNISSRVAVGTAGAVGVLQGEWHRVGLDISFATGTYAGTIDGVVVSTPSRIVEDAGAEFPIVPAVPAIRVGVLGIRPGPPHLFEFDDISFDYR